MASDPGRSLGGGGDEAFPLVLDALIGALISICREKRSRDGMLWAIPIHPSIRLKSYLNSFSILAKSIR